jgi:hypothetical protein
MEFGEFELGLRSFPKIFTLGTQVIKDIFSEPVEVTEKVDGSMWCFGISKSGELVYRSKNQILTGLVVPGMFEIAYQQVLRMEPILRSLPDINGTYFYCEYLNKPKHNCLAYERVPKNNLYLFGVCNPDGTFENKPSILEFFANLLEIEPPKVIFEGTVTSQEQLDEFLKLDSILGKQKIEGIVIKRYTPFMWMGMQMPIMMGKWVSQEFKETHKKTWKYDNTPSGVVARLVEELSSEARWNKAIQHLKEAGVLINDPKDIGALLEEIKRDLIEEEAEYIKEKLYVAFIDDIVRKARQGFPEWYKAQLRASIFEEQVVTTDFPSDKELQWDEMKEERV